MTLIRVCAIVTTIALAACLNSCGDNPTEPTNHSPIIRSLAIFPASIGQTDSAIVVCDASDPDGDVLVYDWFTDTTLRIKGATAGVYLYNSPNNSQIFYYGTPPALPDTQWIRCDVRDRRGQVDSQTIFLIVHE
jgi:hypothetical protein